MMVSVFVLAWNHEKYIEQAIASVVNQTYTDIEILFLDNHSSDQTFELVSELFRNSGIAHKVFKREKRSFIEVCFFINHTDNK